MDLTTLIIFIMAFAGMVIIHEFGHYITALLCGVEVDEFGIGLPTPGAITYWIGKGYLLLKSGKRLDIPVNFRLPANWSELVGGEAKFTADQNNDRLTLRSVEFVRVVEGHGPTSDFRSAEHIYVDQNGQVVPYQEQAAPALRYETVKAGKTRGMQELKDVVTEVHPGTRFTFNWLLLGGFVRPKGENDPKIRGGLAAASPWKRLAIMFAGPLMNLLMAVLIYAFIISRVGVYDTTKVLIASIAPDSPADQGGLKEGDIFVSANGTDIRSFDELSNIIAENQDQPIRFVVDRGGETIELTATPRLDSKAHRPMIGVGLSSPYAGKASPPEALKAGAVVTYQNIRELLLLPAELLRGRLSPEQSRLVGLKGMYDIMQYSVEQGREASQSAPADQPFDWYIFPLQIVAVLSISLGVFNLFPFPALDGGRIIFILPELIFRRRVPHQFENLVHGVGLVVMLLLMLYVNAMDFINPVQIP